MTARRSLPDFARDAATRRKLARWLAPLIELLYLWVLFEAEAYGNGYGLFFALLQAISG